jgi:hypothetical protein
MQEQYEKAVKEKGKENAEAEEAKQNLDNINGIVN